MSRLLLASLALMVFTLPSRSVQAAAIQLLNDQGIDSSIVQFSDNSPLDVWGSTPRYVPIALNYGPQGGIATFQLGQLPSPRGFPNVSLDEAGEVFPISGQFFFNLGVPANNSNNSFAGPSLMISGQFTGEFTVPGDGENRWSGGYIGTATSAKLDPSNSQDLSLLPSPLLDILSHPDHFHFSVYADGGDEDLLTATLTFDPPSPVPTPAPEPTSLITLVAGVALVIYRRRKNRVRFCSPGGATVSSPG